MTAERAAGKYVGYALVAVASACAGLIVGLAIDAGQADPPAPPAVVTPREIVAPESRNRPGRAELPSREEGAVTRCPALPPLPRQTWDDVRAASYFKSDSEVSRTLPADASTMLMRETAFRQAAADVRRGDLSYQERGPHPGLDYCNFLGDPQFGCLLRYVLFADLATERRSLAGPVMDELEDRRHLGLIDPLLQFGRADESSRGVCLDHMMSSFPEKAVVIQRKIQKKEIDRKQGSELYRSLSFWQEWWDDNRGRYMRRGDFQDKIIASLKRLVCHYEDAILAGAPVAQVRTELGPGNVPYEGVTRLIERGHGAEAAALLGYLWAEHRDICYREVEPRLLPALTVATHPSNAAVVARLGFQWSVSRHGIDYIPKDLVTLIRDGVNAEIREAAAELMIAQADRHTPNYIPMQRVLELWESAQDDPLVRRACSDTMAALLPALVPEQPEEATLAYWRKLLVDTKYIFLFARESGIRIITQ